jgi:FkbM family methyltransferase
MLRIIKRLFSNLPLLKVNPPPVSIGEVPKEFIKTFLPENPVIIEAGAHNGTDTIAMAKLWTNSHIYAFEPVRSIFDQLKSRTKSLKNVRCYQLALSDRSGTATFFVSSGQSDASSSLLPPQEHLTEHPNVYFSEQIEISVTTLDKWAEENKIVNVDFLWLDMQGYELATLKASSVILKTVKVIYTEVCLRPLYQGCPLYPEVRDWLESQGFIVAREELAWKDAGNVLFVRKTEDIKHG